MKKNYHYKRKLITTMKTTSIKMNLIQKIEHKTINITVINIKEIQQT